MALRTAPEIKSDFAILDVKKGRANLRRIVGEERNFDPTNTKRLRVPVTIYGFIEGPPHSHDDGVSQEFQIEVTALVTGVPEPIKVPEPRGKRQRAPQTPPAPSGPAPGAGPPSEEL